MRDNCWRVPRKPPGFAQQEEFVVKILQIIALMILIYILVIGFQVDILSAVLQKAKYMPDINKKIMPDSILIYWKA
jgi:hypothetical protein